MRKILSAVAVILLVSGCATTSVQGDKKQATKVCSCNSEIKDYIESLGYEGVVIKEINPDFAFCSKQGKSLVKYEAIRNGSYEERTHCI